MSCLRLPTRWGRSLPISRGGYRKLNAGRPGSDDFGGSGESRSRCRIERTESCSGNRRRLLVPVQVRRNAVFEESARNARHQSAGRRESSTSAAEIYEEAARGLKKRVTPFCSASGGYEWLEAKRHNWRLGRRSRDCTKAISFPSTRPRPRSLIIDISADDIYGVPENSDSASWATRRARVQRPIVNLEIGSLRSVLRRFKVSAAIADDVRMLPVRTMSAGAQLARRKRNLTRRCARSRGRVSLPVRRPGPRHREMPTPNYGSFSGSRMRPGCR